MVCNRCNSRNLRRSRWQVQDAFFLLLFFVPVRCHSCWVRSYRHAIAVALKNKKPLPYMVVNDPSI